MANVKITELTALAAVDVADNDVLPVVDVGNDTTKKVAISDLRTAVAEANDFVTYTQLNANINVVQDNVEARHTQLNANINVVQNNVTSNFNQLDANINVVQNNVTINFNQLDANINVVQNNVTANFNQLDANINVVQDNVTANFNQLDANINVVQDNVTANFNQLNANINVVQNNVAAAEANVGLVRSNLDSFASTSNSNAAALAAGIAGTSVNLTVAADSGSDDVVVVGTDTFTFAGGTGLTSTVSDNQIQFDLDSTAVTAGLYGGVIGAVSNVPAITIDAQGRVTSASNVQIAVDLSTLEGNVNTVSSNVAAVETRRSDNVFFTYNPSGDHANVIINSANVEPSANNTYSLGAPDKVWKDLHVGPGSVFIGANTALKVDSNGDILITQSTDNVPRRLKVDELEIGRGANKVLLKNNNGRLKQRNKDTEVEDDPAQQGDLDNVQSNVASVTSGGTPFTGEVTMNDDLVIQGNLTVNGTTVTVASTDMNITDRILMLANGFTGSPSADVGLLFNRGNQGNAAFFYDESAQTFKISDTKDPHSNTLISPVTSANLDVGILTAATLKYDGTDVSTSITDNVAAVESRRTANIAGAISTVLTTDLTASRALVAGTGGKIEVSDITSTELGYLDGMTQNINSNLVALAAGIAASATGTFPTGDYGLVDSANAATDAFGFAVADLTIFDMSTSPTGELATEDLGAFT